MKSISPRILRQIAIAVMIMCTGTLFADTDEPGFEAEFRNWKLAGTVSGSLNMSRFSDWQAGGDDTVTITGRGDFWAVRSNDRYEWKNRLRSVYGISKINGQEFRTSADSFKLDSRFERKLNSKSLAYVRGFAETSIARKYVYFDTPKNIVIDGIPVFENVDKFRFSTGFDPASFEQGLGIGYTFLQNDEKSTEIKLMTGLGSRQMLSRNYYVRTDSGKTNDIEYTKVGNDFELGVEMVLDAMVTINSYVKLNSFTVLFLGLDDNLWRARWDNSLEVSLGKHVGISLAAEIVYDESVFDDIQMKTGTMITVSYRVF